MSNQVQSYHPHGKRGRGKMGGQTSKYHTPLFFIKKQAVYEFVNKIPSGEKINMREITRQTSVLYEEVYRILLMINMKEGNPCGIENRPHGKANQARLYKL